MIVKDNTSGVCKKLGENVTSKKIEIKPMSETNVGANLMFEIELKVPPA
jgi:hypothetical protein